MSALAVSVRAVVTGSTTDITAMVSVASQRAKSAPLVVLFMAADTRMKMVAAMELCAG